MNRLVCFLVLGGLIVAVNAADAERVPSSKAVLPPSTGARVDITVPYTSNGRTTLGVAGGVAPRVVSDPALDESGDHKGRPVFNLPFFGAVQSFNGYSFGAVERPPNSLRPNR
jgi:hypothetical protein